MLIRDVRLRRASPNYPISIVVPVFNEEETLLKKKIFFQSLGALTELIFVDGGSNDATHNEASRLGQVVATVKNRALQMNEGAKIAKYNILLFLHADTYFPLENLSKIMACLKKNDVVGGCFSQILDSRKRIFKWIAAAGNVRAQWLKIYYGDQGIFVRKNIFWKLGGFPEVAIGEDILLSKRLKKFGETKILPEPIYCSARRFEKQGIWKTSSLNTLISLSLALGLNADSLSYLYEDVRG